MQFIPTSSLSYDQADMFALQSRIEISSNKAGWFQTSSDLLDESQNQGCVMLRSISSFLWNDNFRLGNLALKINVSYVVVVKCDYIFIKLR